MAIRVTMPSSGIFSAIDLFNIIDFIAVEGQVTNLTALSFSGTGVYNGQAASYVATGAGFSLGNIAGETMVVSGVVDKITFTSAGANNVVRNTARGHRRRGGWPSQAANRNAAPQQRPAAAPCRAPRRGPRAICWRPCA